MKAMKSKTVFLCLVVMWCVPSMGHADTLQEAIDESLIVPLATLEAQAEAEKTAYAKYEAAREKLEAVEKKHDAAEDEYYTTKAKASEWFSDVDDTMVKAANEKWHSVAEQFRAALENKNAARQEWRVASDKAKADIADAIAKAKAQQSKKRARHCRATLKPVDDHLKIVEIVKCVQIIEAIAERCSSNVSERLRQYTELNSIRIEATDRGSNAGERLRQYTEDKYLLEYTKSSEMNNLIDTKRDSLKEYATQCVTENTAGYSALVRYIMTPKAKDQYAGLIEKCRQEETNALGVLGYQFIWPCFKGYLDMLDDPLEPPPTEISPEPAEDSDTLPKVKA